MADSAWELPLKALLLLLGGLFVAALMAFFLVYPVWKNIGESENRLANLRTQVQVKEILLPTFQGLQGVLGRLPEAEPYPLPVEEPLGLDMDQLSLMLIKVSEGHGLTTLNISPAMDELAGNAQRIVVNMNMRGPLESFQAFLLHLLQQAYLEQVRSMQIREAGLNREYELEFALRYR